MRAIDNFLALVETELGLSVTPEEATQNLDELPGWDSLQLLSLIGAIERRTGRSVSLARALDASSLEEIYTMVVRT